MRLFAIAALSIGVALVTTGLFTRQAVRMELRALEVSRRMAGAPDVAASAASGVGRAWPTASSPTARDSLLAAVAGPRARDLLLIGPDGERLAASTSLLAHARVRSRAAGRLVLDLAAGEAGIAERRQLMLSGAPGAVVRDPRGQTIGTLYVLPPGGRGPLAASVPFRGAFDLRLLAAALIAGMAALALSWVLGRRIVEPIQALTAAARRLGAGDLGARVPLGGPGELAQLSHTFNAMAAELARQETLRRTMVSDVAHELRTPLTNLRAQIEAVEDGLLQPVPETLRSLREEVLLLARLVDDLQTLSIAESGRLALDRAPVSVRDLVDGALEAMRAEAAARGLTLVSTVGEVPRVDADPARIAQVLRNLLANAARHTPPGGRIEVGASGSGGEVTVVVTDSGHGIAPEHLPHVFERFYRADPSRARATGGAGLGLAIVRSIVEAHGGTVGVASEPGRGAAFRFSLPVARADSGPSSVLHGPAAG